MQRLLHACLAAVAVFAAQAPVRADDTDLFVQPPGAVSGLPNVLILLDNTANWNTPFTAEKTALVNTVTGLQVGTGGTAKYRLGLMLFTETGNPNNNVDGGYMRAAIRNLDSNYKTKMSALVNSLDVLGDKSNGGKAGKTMSEAYQYFSGLAPYSGNNKVKTDYTGNVTGTAQSKAIYALAGNAISAFAGSPYVSPIVSGSCAGNYIVYISNGPVQDNASDTSTATTQLQTAATAAGINGATTAIPISPSGSQDNVADEWARFMKKSPRAITTYTVDVNPGTNGQGPGWTALLKSMASVSGGKYFAVTTSSGSAALESALGRIFSEIQAVNSVFASVSLPVSVNTEGTYLNQVYIGMFRPDADGFPRWAGNLKQYKLGQVGNELRTLDADGNQAINSSTGFITECARSFWTPTAADSYWAFRPQGGCTMGGVNYDNSNYPDGKVVEKGAQAYVLRGSTTRTMRTCSSTFSSCSSAGALTDFNNSITNLQALLGAANTTERDALVNWFKGLDVDDENINAVTTTEMRPSAHGDVVHSRPVAINFGTDASPKVVVFYAGNEGVLRAVNGNRSTNIGTVTPGKELWAFVPPEFYGQIKRLRDNSTQINFQGNPTTTPTPLPKPYGMDGAITSYNNTSLFVGMRRGGRALYAFNITDIAAATPVAPRLLWKRGCPNLANDTGCSAGFSGIGQTWSAAKVMKVAGYTASGSPAPLLIMGGGYDPCEDVDPPSDTCKSNSKGRYVYLIDASNGTLVSVFPTDRGVIGDVFVITDPNTGLAKYAYVADLGGNIYRISGSANTPTTGAFAAFGSTPPAGWNITKIASLGCDATTCGSGVANRKFMFMPDIVEKDGVYYLLVGSGDREKPLDAWPSAYGVDNYFFMVKDNPSDGSWLTSENAHCSADVICLDSLVEVPADSNPSADDLAAAKGWYLPLNDHEQVVTSAITVYGTTTFSTHTPAVPVAGQCTSNLGTARVYNVRFLNAAAKGNNNRGEIVSGGGLPPSPVAGMVTLDDGRTVPFIIGADPDSPLESELPESPSTGTQPRSLTYWYIEK
ncbi:MAG: pilus assembly protein PilY [Gammaproteobacteria bacterium]|nr:pilus assembly protein PilY [Gammaproteobacteria bacterium]